MAFWKQPTDMLKALLSHTLVLYIIGGSAAACIHIAIVAGLVESFEHDKESANTAGFVVGVVVNYLFQYFITFRSSASSHWQQFPLFAGFAVIGLVVNRFVYSHGLNDLHLQYLVAAALGIGAVFIFNFTANRLITFKDTGEGHKDPMESALSEQKQNHLANFKAMGYGESQQDELCRQADTEIL